MKSPTIVLALAMLTAGPALSGGYPDCFVFAHRNLAIPDQMQEMSNIVCNAAACGYNGLVFWCGRHYAGRWGDVHSNERGDAKWRGETSGIEDFDLWPQDRQTRLRKVDKLCRDLGCPLIPLVWSVGYCSMQSRDLGMIAVAPVRDVPYVRQGDAAVWARETCDVPNGGFETASATGPFAGWVSDGPNRLVFRDTEVKRSGSASARVICSALAGSKAEFPMARTYQTVKVRPYRRYRLTAWYRSKDFVRSGDGAARLMVLGGGMTLAKYGLPLARTQDWKPYSIIFNSLDSTEVRVYVGAWMVTAGTVWIDDVSIEPFGVRDVLRRAGAPVRVRDAATGKVYREGADYAPIPSVARLDFESRGGNLSLALPSGSAIPPGAKLLVDCYEPVFADRVQCSACLANPALKAYYAESARRIERLLSPDRWFLSADEFRVGCRCELCAKAAPCAELFAQTVRDQFDAIQAVHPGATCYAWADMFDPSHNAQKSYYTCGDMRPRLERLPRELVMVSWWDRKCRLSFDYFSSRGFRTLGAGYYDKRTADKVVENVRRWTDGLNATPGGRGILYTTWSGERGNYEFLPLFAREFARRAAPKN